MSTKTHPKPLDIVRASARQSTINCPQGPAAKHTHCTKVLNPAPGAPWDFAFFQTRQTLGKSSQLSIFVPLLGGGLRRIVSRTNTQEILQITHLSTYEAETLDAGAVRFDALETRDFYRATRSTLFEIRGTTQDFDAECYPLGPPRPKHASDWPPLPNDAALTELLHSLVPQRQGGPQVLNAMTAGVAFQTVVPTADGDFEVGDGELFVGETPGRSLPRGSTEIFSSFQDGIPGLATNDYYRIEDGRYRRLHGDRAAQNVASQVIEVYRDRSRRGLFRSKRRLSTIRQELRVDSTVWENT